MALARIPARGFAALAITFWLTTSTAAADVDPGPLLAKIRAVGPNGAGHREATQAWRRLAEADARQLPEILAGMDGANALATNWIRAAVDAVAERQLRKHGALPLDRLEAFLADRKHASRARRAAYEWIRRADPRAEERLVPGFLNDPSLELRRDAVAKLLEAAEATAKQDRKDEAISQLRRALTAARDLDQIELGAKRLRDFGEAVDLPSHFGFVLNWQLIGPFDNAEKKGFDVAYPPEAAIDFAAKYQGKSEEATWREFTSKDDYGIVDLNAAVGKVKGAIAYAYAEFNSAAERPADLRIGTANANKIWLNGKLITANEVYHANMQIDQYVGQGTLRKGKNTILVKLAQNEQTEEWAERWNFQLRVCDENGTALQ